MRVVLILKRVAATAAGMAPGGLYYLTDMVGLGGALFLAAAGGFVGFTLTLPSVSAANILHGTISFTPLALFLDSDSPWVPSREPEPAPAEPEPDIMDPRWKTENVLGIARAIRAERAVHLLPILGDALRDAGCSDDEILACCRLEDGPTAGLWLVDLLLDTQPSTAVDPAHR